MIVIQQKTVCVKVLKPVCHTHPPHSELRDYYQSSAVVGVARSGKGSGTGGSPWEEGLLVCRPETKWLPTDGGDEGGKPEREAGDEWGELEREGGAGEMASGWSRVCPGGSWAATNSNWSCCMLTRSSYNNTVGTITLSLVFYIYTRVGNRTTEYNTTKTITDLWVYLVLHNS